MGLIAVFVFETFMACANRKHPVGAHLHTFVEGLQSFVIEGVFAGFLFGGPDHGFMRVGEAFATEVGHRIRFAPHSIIEDPEALVLQLCAHAEHVVIATNDPDCAIWLQQATCCGKPVFGEAVVDFEAVELIPIIVDGVDLRIVRAMQVAAQLEVIGRVRETRSMDSAGRLFMTSIQSPSKI